jgi:catechol 2,3-dioxygenase-like lactoylglutathione lyase family enzyme
MPEVTGVLETALHAEDVARSAGFYQSVLGFDLIVADTDRFRALSVAGKALLLIFKKGGTGNPVTIPGGVIPPHGGDGELHVAFSIPAEEWDAWIKRLESHRIPVESIVRWERGGRSVYFRDPDRHLVELVTPGCWAIY